jgi:5-hydroxyisourate hydrolase
MTAVTTHVLDTARGAPAAGVPVVLEAWEEAGWRPLATAVTDADGRAPDLGAATAAAGLHRLVFTTGEHLGPDAFFPEVTVVFVVPEGAERLHVPLLLAPFGYTTYRGS